MIPPPLEVKPEVFNIGYQTINWPEMTRALRAMGVTSWFPSDGVSDGEALAEFYGRMCYRSFEVGLNPNVTRIRTDTESYIRNIAASFHGSVMEHINVNFLVINCSRVFTHELVRHRAGTAISQESMRYVRMDQGISMPIPEVIRANPQAATWAYEKIQLMGRWQQELSYILGVETMKSFEAKKIATSAMRRFVGDGVATRIGWSANIRALRHIIALRTDPSAEEEMRIIFDMIALKCKEMYPFFFADFTRSEDGSWRPEFVKV